MTEKKRALPAIIESTEELIFNSCYAPFDLSAYLQSAETRSRIRKLPATQVFYSLKNLDQEEMSLLLPQITEEQWATFLDLDLWDKDELNTNALLFWEKFTLAADEPVAKKLVRATDPELLQLLWKRELQLIARVEEDEFEAEPPIDRDTFITPDNNYIVVLPEDPEVSRLVQGVLTRLYQLDADYARMSLEASRYAVSMELEEAAYQNTRRRTEDFGFQDYFSALEIYTPKSPDSLLPEKETPAAELKADLPARADKEEPARYIFLEALASISRQDDIEALLQELFFVCNKVISADRGTPGDPDSIKAAISKAQNGISVGLDLWAGGNLRKAEEGLSQHYLSSFFQIGYGALLKVSKAAAGAVAQDSGSYAEAVIEGLKAPYPLYTESEEKNGRITFSTRYFRTASEIEETLELLEQLTA